MNRIVRVAAAAGAVVVLAASLAVRVSARMSSATEPMARPAAASVPPPVPIDLSELDEPFCWGCRWNQDVPLEFQVDLDLLAPLGTGGDNAAVWFAEFARGGRRDVAKTEGSYRERRVPIEIDGVTWNVLPADDPLLLEAEPWIDQARCSFYPEVWPVEGIDTSLPNLLMTLDLARSWTARGKLANDSETAKDDFRRAIRLGRLLRQDDVSIIQDLVAIACIRIGAEAMYDLARDEGDAATMLVSSLVMADKDAMRFNTARRITTFERAFREGPGAVTDADVEAIVDLLRGVSERRFRVEGLISLFAIKHLGSDAQRETATTVLDEFAGNEDELTADLARHYRDATLDGAALESFLASVKHPS